MPHLVTMGLAFAQVCGCIGKDFFKWQCFDKVEKILKGSLDSIPSPSPSVKI